jgi:hypothetical protein
MGRSLGTVLIGFGLLVIAAGFVISFATWVWASLGTILLLLGFALRRQGAVGSGKSDS